MKKTSKYIELWGEFNPEFVIMRSDGTEERIRADKRFKDTNAHQWRQKADGKYQVKKQGTDEWIDAKKLDGDSAIDIPAKPVRNSKGDIIEDIHKRADDTKAVKKDLSGREKARAKDRKEADKKAKQGKVNELLEKRKTQQLTPAEQRILDDYHVQKNKVTIASRDIGEVGAESAMKNKYPDFELTHGGVNAKNSSGTFDQIYVKKGPPKEFIIVEAKGGSADVGSANVTVGSEIKRAEQGTKEYMGHIIGKMEKSGDMKLEELAEEMKRARKKRLKYFKAQTPIDENGKVVDTILTEFKI